MEHHLHLGAGAAKLGALEPCDVAAVESDGAGGRLDELQREATEGRLAGTGFPHQTDAFPRLHEEVDAVDRLHMTLHTPENVLARSGSAS